MKRNYLLTLTLSLLLLIALTVSGVSATWVYLGDPTDVNQPVNNKMADFRYGTIYITNVKLSGGSYASAESRKIADLDISTELTLQANAASSVVVEVTFYNNTNVSYYYDEAETLSHSNQAIDYTVSGIIQKEEIPAHTYKTVTVTYAFSGNSTANRALASSTRFHFVVDKESIGDVVAQTAVDRFRDILNNKVAPDSYSTLETAMNNRGSIFNKASAVTYIGNVTGSSSTDSQVIQSLFGEEFMSMDLDGDGNAERITMMIKREDLDGNVNTGASYTYDNNKPSVNGVEFTIYITAADLRNASSRQDVVVYAATFTKYSTDEEWVQIVPLTKGEATPNNYNGYGSANSFNTDTWHTTDNKTIEDLVEENT